MKYPWKHAIITGLIEGIFAAFAFSFVNGLNKHFAWGINPANIRGVIGLLTLIILGIGIYTGMQSVKRLNQGTLTYKQAVRAGILVAITVGILVSIFGFIYTNIINPGYAAYMVEEGRKAMIAEGQSPTQIASGTANLQTEFSAPAQIMQSLVGQSVCGTLISLVMALFIRTKK